MPTTLYTKTGTDASRLVTTPQVRAFATNTVDPAPPTITVQASGGTLAGATSTLTGTLIKPGDAGNVARYNAFRVEQKLWSGSAVFGPRPPHRGDGLETDASQGFGNSIWSIDFDFYGDAFEVPIIDSTLLRVVTDGRYASLVPTAGVADGNFRYVKVQYPSNGYRRIRIETGLTASGGFPGGYISGIKIKTGQGMYPPSVPNTKRFAIVHDSYGNGGSATTADLRGYSGALARLLGFTDYVNLCIAGSGLTTGGAGNTQKFGFRIDDLVAAQPAYLFLPGSVNDYAQRATTLSSEAAAFWSACKTQLPNTRILASGPASMVPANGDALNAVLKPVAASVGIEYVDTTGWTASLPADLVDVDNYHPTVEGHNWIARRFAAVIAGLWNLPT